MSRVRYMLAGYTVGVAAVLSVCLPATVSAHVLKQNNGVSVVMHIDPDDNPVAGTSTVLDLTFGNVAGDFALSDYSIHATVMENNAQLQQVLVAPTVAGATENGAARVTFPDIDVYQVIVAGRSLRAGVPSFRVDYLVRVATSVNGASAQGDGLIPLLASVTSLILLTMVAVRSIVRGRRYVPSRKK